MFSLDLVCFSRESQNMNANMNAKANTHSTIPGSRSQREAVAAFAPS